MATTTLDGTGTPYQNNAGATITAADGDTLILLGTIHNQGTILENSTGDYTVIEIGGSTVTLNGGGDVVLAESSTATGFNQNYLNSQFDPNIPLHTLDNVDNTISGSGELLLYSVVLKNEAAGVIDANGGTGNGLDAYGPGGIVNAGLVEATGVGGMFLSTNIDQSGGGTLLASGAGVILEIYTGDVTGGTLTTTDGGLITVLAGTIDGSATQVTITSGSTVQATSSYSLTLLGTIDNAGTLLATGGAELILASPTVTLTGGGAVTLGGYILGADATAHLFINENNTIAGSGYIGRTTLPVSVTNEAAGTIDATGGINFYQTASGTLRNAGLLEATGSGSLLVVGGTIDNTGGTLLANGTTITLEGVALSGGTGSVISTPNGGEILFYNTDSWGTSSQPVNITAGDTIAVAGTLNILSSALHNAGTIMLGDPDALANTSFDLVLNAATTTLDGGGTIELVPNISIFVVNDNEVIGATTTPAVLENVDNTIAGSGDLGSTTNPLALINDVGGIIDASSYGGSALTINTVTLRNAGLLESTGRRQLIVNSTTIDNAGGTILTAGNPQESFSGDITLNAVDVVGGTVMTTTFTDNYGNPSQAGGITFAGGASTLDGGTGTMTVGALTQLAVQTGSTLDLIGTIDWQNATLQTNGGVTNAGTVTGTGQFAGDLVNTGVVRAYGGTFDITGAVTGAGSMAIAAGGTFELGGASAEAFDFGGATGSTLILDTPSAYTGALTNVAHGDFIQLDSVDVASTQVLNGTTLAITLMDNSVIDYGVANLPKGAFFHIDSASASQSTLSVECFAEGTRIRTCDGETKVEDLTVGDMVPTCLDGSAQRIVWIGRRAIDCEHHPDPRRVRPIRIAAHAFGPALPARDLVLSPDHAVLVAGVLVPVKYLTNGSSIVQLPVDRITYYHVELARHDVLRAEGLPVESYLDTGHRVDFASGGPDGPLAPDIAAVWDAFGCAPLVVTGPALAAARALVDAQIFQVAAA
jgi:hypothetical protein